ncbi:MAG: acetylxylan esterase [Armatimonadetes bacterium]|nr:acetylxylan esterase [Armatimonadota bacterium]
MALFDLCLDQLQSYKPDRIELPDFDAFWQATLESARQHPLQAAFEPIQSGLIAQDCFDLTFHGFGGQPIKGWLVLPKNAKRPLPCVVEYLGYTGGRGFATDWLQWSCFGYAHAVMDTRGQGAAVGWTHGDTADAYGEGGSPSIPGFMTQGILDPKHYYYRRVFTDAVRMIEAVRGHEAIDPARICVTGGSQGGGITIAAAGLVSDVQAAMPDVPFLCHYRRATEIVDSYPYQEIARFCNVHRDKTERVFQTLSYFDGVNLGARAKARTLFSVGMMDQICPPSTVFAAYNHWGGADRAIEVYPYNGHEGGGGFHNQCKIRFLKELWG